MNELLSLDPEDVLTRAAKALSLAAGTSQHLQDPEILSEDQRRNLVVRARAVHEDGRSQSVIIKAPRQANYDPNCDAAFERHGLIREWIASAYIAAHAPARGHGAPLLAADRDGGILVYEDLGSNLGSLVGPLLEGSAEEAERALTSYASAVGRFHADTIRCSDAHAETLKSLVGTRNVARSSLGRFELLAGRVQARIGGSLPKDELAQVSSRLNDPGVWLALVHGDPCPDNALVVKGEVRLIDFEFTRPGHALLDAIYWQFGFPTCWCAGRVPPEIASRVDAAYRTEVSRSIQAASDDNAYRVECAYVAAAWLLESLEWRLAEALREDKVWGVASLRSRLLWYLEATIAIAGRANVLPGVQSGAEIWLASLRNRWPATAPLGFYAAFTA